MTTERAGLASAPTPLCLVAAIAANRVIGLANRLPWHLPADLAHFKQLTLDRTIVMGRLTWASLPGPLPRRRHIVVSRDPAFRPRGATPASSLDEAIEVAGAVPELMIVGGAQLYREALPRAERLLLTLIHAEVAGDTFFPPWDPQDWQERQRTEHPADARNVHAMTFLELCRRHHEPLGGARSRV
ncbi:type 3 dihydrofolate reductase [Thiocapsa imhoffii]|uniref:type 3 dihydrofolate reductase n=1 Tax=Thiocapsa imhoffii TaxID=382777 RepID=UPI0030B8AAB6